MKIVLSFLMICSFYFAKSQSIKSIIAYKHINNVGNIPMLEEGQEYKFTYTYFIYIESTNNKIPLITNVIYKNTKCTFDTVVIKGAEQLYVYNDGSKQDTITLLPKGKKNMYKLNIQYMAPQKDEKYTNELIIHSKVNGVTKINVLKAVKEIPGSVMQ